MKQFIRIGVDLAKNYFQVHALTSEGGPALTRKLTRLKMREFFAGIDPCLAGMEACASALLSQTKGLGARTFGDGSRRAADPADLCQALRQTGAKNDAADAAAIEPRPCHAEAMRFVLVKSAESQATLMLHKRVGCRQAANE